MERCITLGPFPYIFDINNEPITMTGTFKLPVKIETCLVHVELVVCQSLVSSVVVSAGCSVETRRPRKKLIELQINLIVPIVTQPMKRSVNLLSLPPEQESNRSEGRLTIAVRATETTVILPFSQKMIKLHSKRRGFVVL